MKKAQRRQQKRERRHRRIRAKVSGTAARPRLSVFRSNRYLYAQLVDDDAGRTLAAASSREAGVKEAAAVGDAIAKRAREKGIECIVFDRAGYPYRGNVRKLAEAARAAGLTF